MRRPPNEFLDILNRAGRVLVATHVYPDGDALGSLLALAGALEAGDKQVFRYSEDKASHLYDFLPGADRLQTVLPESLKDFDCAVALDCGDRFRLGREMERLLTIKPLLVIDHHAGHQPFGDLSWVEADRGSTGEMVYDLLRSLDCEISRDTAYCLYTAIVADTGSFKYSSTTADTFRVARDLTAHGVKPAEVAGKLFDNYTVNRLHLLTEVLATLSLYAEDRIAIISVTRQMLERTGTSQADTENFINYPRAISSVKVAAFIKEAEDDLISVSLRSKGASLDVARIAAGFGGGGHRNAVGFKLGGASIDEIRERLLRELNHLLEDTR